MGQYISDREPSTLSSDRTVVTFSTIEFHEHAIILGDNPATCDGPSLEIDWTEIGSPSKVGIEEYEKLRSPRRIKDQLRMPSFVREEV